MTHATLCPLVMHFMSSCDIDPGFQDSVDESNINIWRKYRKQRTCGKFLNVWQQHPFSSSPDFWITDRKNWLSRIIRFVSYQSLKVCMANLTSYTHNLQTMTDTDVWEDRGIDRREGLMNLILHQTNVATKARRISTLAPRMLPSDFLGNFSSSLPPCCLDNNHHRH